ncbi:MAG: SRPBCC family protein [Candidatus Electrothrix sp. GW3-4]|uniref:SRPBCC family protein n=1 Tax=Candidatus Electrothrix sp. GW3-4 TaxID=3126740 RepID=UPI0030D35F07
MTGQQFNKPNRPFLLLVLGCSMLCFVVTAWAGSPVQPSGATAPLIKLTSQEQQAVENKEVIIREQPTQGKPGKAFAAVAIIEARREVIRDIVTDYQSYPEFMPNVSRIDILEQDKSTAVLNYLLSLPLGKSKKYRIRLESSEPDEQTSLIQWQLQPWPELKPAETIRDTSGFWRIETLENGRSLVFYHVYTDPGKIPFGLGWIVDFLSKDSVPEVLAKTRERAERMNALLTAQEN